MTPEERAAFIDIQVQTFGKRGSAKGRKKIIEFIAAQIKEAVEEAHIEIATKQSLVHGESFMLNVKVITNEELYKFDARKSREGEL